METGDEKAAKVYLGDGVYVDHDGFGIWLTTVNGTATTNRIYLEPDVWKSLVTYVDRMKKR